jgi:glutathione S-transferase
MHGLTLVIGSKNGSSWSLRPWLLLRQAGLAFEEVLIQLRQPDTAARILRHSPSGKVPVLLAGGLRIWDSLAIAEYLAEREPSLWPADPGVRAVARSVSAEMHSGFAALRTFLPMDFTARFGPPGKLLSPVAADVRRILEIWAGCRREHGRAGPFLFGGFTIADAMFAPVCSRFTTYAVPLDAVAQAYVAHMMSLTAMLEWGRGAAAEVASDDMAAPIGRDAAAEPERLPAAFAPVTLEVEPAPAKAEVAPAREPPPPPKPEPAPIRARTEPAPQPPPAPMLPPPRSEPTPGEPPAELRHMPRPIPSTIMVKPIGDGTRRRR